MYIGKKNFKGRGKKNKGVESNWKSYCSSSKLVQELITEKGESAFEFYILEQYTTPSGLNWGEVWTQTFCAIPENNDRFLNRYIDKITYRVLEPVTKKHKTRLNAYLRKHPLLQPTGAGGASL